MWSDIISRSKPRPSTVSAQRRSTSGSVPGPKFGTFTPSRTGPTYRVTMLAPASGVTLEPLRTGQLAFQRGAETWRDPGLRGLGVLGVGADPLAEPLRLGVQGRRGLGADVLEQPDRDLAVLALRPAAHDPAVPPGRRADVPGPVEQGRPVLADVPGALAPAHRGGVESGQQRRRGPGSGRPGCTGRSRVGGEHDAGCAVQVDLGDVQPGQGLPGLA